MSAPIRPKILCVDDEPRILEALEAHFGRRYTVLIAPSGGVGLEVLKRHADVTVVVSDLNMPGMDGAAFLAQVRLQAPEATRILLTGNTGLDAAIHAVNEGQIFRFLSKPCPLPVLTLALEAGVAQHRLVTAERVLLEQTLHGSIKTLTDVLALTNPLAFGRANRIKAHVTALATRLELEARWQVEVAAMLSQLGCITLPPETVEKLYHEQTLSYDEERMVRRLPEVTEGLLGNIPRLEDVRAILRCWPTPHRRTGAERTEPPPPHLRRACQILLLATDYDARESVEATPLRALDKIRAQSERYDPEVLGAFLDLRLGSGPGAGVLEVEAADLAIGMVFVEDVMTPNGTILVARGYEVTDSFLHRVRNFRPGTVKEPLRVRMEMGAAPP